MSKPHNQTHADNLRDPQAGRVAAAPPAQRATNAPAAHEQLAGSLRDPAARLPLNIQDAGTPAPTPPPKP